MALTVLINGFNLSPYLRLNPDDQADLIGSGFEDPQFLESTFVEGNRLLDVDVGNREQTFPVHLTAPNRAALIEVIRQLRLAIGQRPGLLEVKPNAGSESTYYDVTFARFDADWSYRKSERNWVSGTVRVWSAPPYGHTGTMRLVGSVLTSSGTAAGLGVRMPLTNVGGDVDALSQVLIKTTGPSSALAGMAVLPPGYVCELNPVFNAFGWAASQIISDVGVPNERHIRGVLTSNISVTYTLAAPTVNPWVGRNRVLQLVRVAGAVGTYLAGRVHPDTGTWITPPAELSPISSPANAWQLIDLGVMSVPTSPVPSSPEMQPDTILTVLLAPYNAGGGGGGSHTLELGNTLVLPELTSAMVSMKRASNQATVVFDSVTGLVSQLSTPPGRSASTFFLEDLTSKMRGAPQPVRPGASLSVYAFGVGNLSSAPRIMANAAVSVRERFSFTR